MAGVVIDPGHGGAVEVGGSSANNATGPLGTQEKSLTLSVGLKCRDILAHQGLTVLMTRNSDVNLSLAERAHVARDIQADAFVSIHFNGWTSPDVQGTETYVYTGVPAQSGSRILAALVQREVHQRTGYTDRGVKEQNLGVLNPLDHFAGTAACLVEISFITDPADEQRLIAPATGDAYQATLAEGISVAIYDFVTARFRLFEHAHRSAKRASLDHDA